MTTAIKTTTSHWPVPDSLITHAEKCDFYGADTPAQLFAEYEGAYDSLLRMDATEAARVRAQILSSSEEIPF